MTTPQPMQFEAGEAAVALSAYHRLHQQFHGALLGAMYTHAEHESPFRTFVDNLGFVTVDRGVVTLDTTVDAISLVRNCLGVTNPTHVNELAGVMLTNAFKRLGIHQTTVPDAFAEYVLREIDVPLTERAARRLMAHITPKGADWQHNIGILAAVEACPIGELLAVAREKIEGIGSGKPLLVIAR